MDEILDQDLGSRNQLIVDNKSIAYLGEIRKWSRFLAIVGFVILGIMIFFGLSFSIVMSSFVGDEMGSVMSGILVFFYILFFGLIVFFPSYYLFKSSQLLHNGLKNKHQLDLTQGLENLKSFFKFYGIYTLVFLILLGFLVLIMVLVGGSSFLMR